MSEEQVTIGMTPPHPGAFIRAEILEELGLSISRAAVILGVRRATLSRLVNGRTRLVAGDGTQDRNGLRRVDGHSAAHGGVARQPCYATPRSRDRRQALSADVAVEDGLLAAMRLPLRHRQDGRPLSTTLARQGLLYRRCNTRTARPVPEQGHSSAALRAEPTQIAMRW